MLSDLYEIAPGSDDLMLRVHVQPGAGRTAVMGRHGDALKVKVAAPPEGGRANDAVTRLLAETLGVPVASVRLESGEKSRDKRLRIVGVSGPELERLVGLAVDAAGRGTGGRTAS
ncbi:MAG TPA: DUF167 domain-containing protein [Acidimicrobiales bacterium]